MRTVNRICKTLLLCLACMCFFQMYVSAEQSKEMKVVFTHDLHSHLESFELEENGEEQQVGGFARMKTWLEQQPEDSEDILFLDGGDFSMGTLYQTVFETQAAELRMLGALGVDVTTFGNHEFDYRSSGLANMLAAAENSKDPLPALVVCNIDWEASLSGEQADESALLKDAFDRYGVQPYVMLEKNGVKIAVIGVFGKDSLACSPTCALSFKEPVDAVRETVQVIEQQEHADMIVCVSHSGTWEEEKKSEDELLAKAVPQIDLIISGHTHSILEKPIIHGETAIVSTGEYGARIGSMNLKQKENGRWQLEDYQLTLLDKRYENDAEIQKKTEEMGKSIDQEYMAQFGYKKDQVLTYNPWEFTKINGLGTILREETLGNLLADSYLYTVNNSETGDETPAKIAVVPSGCIRDTFHKDRDITAADAFQSLSLGIGADGIPGYPLVSVYLTGADIRTMAEVDASISPMMTTAQLYTSGLSYTINPSRLMLNKVTNTVLQDWEGNVETLMDDSLYRVVADLYTGQMLGAVEKKSFGLLSVVPRDASGEEISAEKLEDYIIYRDGKELKAWICAANYLDSFEKINGNSQIPEYYQTTHNRKVIENDSSFVAFMSNPSQAARMIFSIAAVLVVVLMLLVVLMIYKIAAHKKKRDK
ncbi:MAG: bifunctional metallophosphatase/5'-nucleotidase [Lachnospiraceae bacterium]|nr:bifunctional metallophosphatase/5'-nucleotidase [Lachnospiraceae bacterium]